MRAAFVCGALCLAVAIYAVDVSSDVNADEVTSIGSDGGAPSINVATPTDCKQVRKSLPSLCAVFGEEHCASMKSKMLASCKDVPEETNELLEEAEESPEVADVSADDHDDHIGEGMGRRGGGGALMTSGSFTMMSNRGGNSEAMLGDSNDDEETDKDKVEDWDIHNGGKCKQDEEAWMQTDAEDKNLGHCVQFAADTKCGAQCFHQGKSVDETVDGAVCSKICRVPGANGAQCNVIKTVQPIKEESEGGKTMYLTRSKVMQAGLKLDDLSNADPMACAGVATNRRS